MKFRQLIERAAPAALVLTAMVVSSAEAAEDTIKVGVLHSL